MYVIWLYKIGGNCYQLTITYGTPANTGAWIMAIFKPLALGDSIAGSLMQAGCLHYIAVMDFSILY